MVFLSVPGTDQTEDERSEAGLDMRVVTRLSEDFFLARKKLGKAKKSKKAGGTSGLVGESHLFVSANI